MENQEIPFMDKTLTETAKNKEFLTPKMLIEDPTCPFSEKALRFHIWRSGVNGLAPAIFRVGSLFLVLAITSEVNRLRGRFPSWVFHQDRCCFVFDAFLGF